MCLSLTERTQLTEPSAPASFLRIVMSCSGKIFETPPAHQAQDGGSRLPVQCRPAIWQQQYGSSTGWAIGYGKVKEAPQWFPTKAVDSRQVASSTSCRHKDFGTRCVAIVGACCVEVPGFSVSRHVCLIQLWYSFDDLERL